MSARTIDLNADLGEGFPNDAALLARVSSASIACGAHAGDASTMAQACSEAQRHGVALGAHPGYPDRAGFGRREQRLPPGEIERLVIGQVELLRNVAAPLGVPIRFVKPHGALYNQAQKEDDVAAAVVAALAQLGCPLLGQPGSLLESRARDAGVRYVTEGFPDRRYREDGRLMPRSEPNAIVHDPAEIEAQVVRLVGQGVMTLCIHGDDPHAVANADTVRAILERHGIALRSFA